MNVYEGFCGELGILIEVRFRREVIDIFEDLLGIGNVFIEKRYYKLKLSGSFCEGFRLKIFDEDIMYWCISDKVICNFF